MPADTIAEQFADFVVNTSFAEVPEAIVPLVRDAFTDCIGVALAASHESVVAQVQALASLAFAGERAAVMFVGEGRLSVGGAALVNGTAAHALDFDDAALDAHPSAVLVPALMACFDDSAGALDGRGLVTAYAVGYEVWAELYARLSEPLYARGFHPTGVFGSVAAAAAVAHVLRLDRATTVHALGLAASLASGLVANFGTSAKPLHAGRAAQNGVFAVYMARSGLQASPEVFEHPQGFLRSFAGSGELDLASPVACGKPWRLLQFGLSFKLYPVCYGAHRVLAALSALVARRPVAPEAIDRVVLEIGRSQLIPLSQHRPDNARQARFSAEFVTASMLLTGECGLAQLTDDFVRSAPVRALISKVEIVPLDEKDAEEPVFSPYDRVTLHTRQGEVLVSDPVRRAPGHILNPATTQDLWLKFAQCTRHLPAVDSRMLFDTLQQVDRWPGPWVLPRVGLG